jgi:hypothetical protein
LADLFKVKRAKEFAISLHIIKSIRYAILLIQACYRIGYLKPN